MKTIKVMVGLPGSGKSTYVKEHVDKYDLILSSDAIRELGHRDPFKHMDDLIQKAKDVDNIETIYYDACNIEYHYRKMFYERWKDYFNIECIVLDTPFTDCLERVIGRNNSETQEEVPLGVLYAMKNKCESPVEGFDCDKITIIEENND